MSAAARITDPIAHTHAMTGLLVGLVAGALLGAAIVATGGLALVAVAGAAAALTAGAGIGEVIGSMDMCGAAAAGNIGTGSPDVAVNSKAAARAHLDIALCSQHAPVPSLLAQGSASVYINGQPFVRVGDMLTCSAKVQSGSGNVFVGGETQTTDDIEPEIPDWVHNTLLAVGLASAVILTGPVVALLGLAGGYLGGKAGEILGERWYGKGSDGQKWMMLGGSVIGGILGAKGGSALTNRFIPTPTSSTAAFVKGGVPAMGKFNAGQLAASERPCVGKTCAGEPIDMVTGEVIMQQTDLCLPGSLPIMLRRVHTSGNPNGTLFGKAWASTWGQWLEVLDDGQVIFHNDDGASMRFEIPPVGGSNTHRIYRSVRLTRLSDGYKIEQRQQATLYFRKRDFPHWRLTAMLDRNGNQIDFIYDGMALAEVRHSGGTRLMITNEDLAIARIALLHPDGQQSTLISYRYDQQDELCDVINSSGLPLTYTYDQAHRLTRWQDRNGKWFAYRYDANGRCVQTHGGDGYLNGCVSYDDENRINCYTDGLGNRTEYHYNASFLVTREIDARGGVTELAHDDGHNLIMTALPGGAVLRRQYDERGNLTSFINALDKETRIEWNQIDLPTCITTPDGRSVQREYDANGNLNRVGQGKVWTGFAHDECGNLTQVRNPAGTSAKLEYDEHGWLLMATDWQGNPTRFTRDALGRVIARTDAQGNTSRYRYTIEGRLLEIILPDGSRHSAAYDAEGNRISQTDALGNVTRFEYGAFDILAKTIEANGAVTQYQYDAELLLTSIINPEGQPWRYRYNATGQVIEETDFAGRTQSFEIDAAGFVSTSRSSAGNLIRYRRNHGGQLLEKTCGDETATFVWDVMGRLTRASNPDADIRFERDFDGNVVREIQNGKVIANRYNILGQRIARENSGQTSIWEFDANGLPAELVLPDAHAFAFVHDSLGREIARQLPGGVQISQEFDQASRLKRQWTGTPGQNARTLAQRGIDYDGNGKPKRLGDLQTGATEFELDPAGQITAARQGKLHEQYAYDLAGNLIEAIKQKSRLAGDDSNADAQGARQHQAGRLLVAGKIRYEYDLDGRIVTRTEGKRWGRQQVWRYTWNHENRLRSVTTPDGDTWQYRYDAFGRRISKQHIPQDPRQIFSETEYLWDGHTLAAERRLRKKPDHHGECDILDDITTTWEFEPGTFRPLAKTDTTRIIKGSECETRQTYAVVLDHIGTPRELISADGKLAWQAKTNIWGEVEAITVNKTDCPLRFQGQYFDEESKLAYNWHRYYDPSSGRYLTPDPLGLQGGPNPYAYVNNPLASVDPLGLEGGDGLLDGMPLPDETVVHRLGGGQAGNLIPKPGELKLTPPGISVFSGGTKEAAAAQMKAAFPDPVKFSRLHEAANTVGSATAKDIRAAGFDVIHNPTDKFDNHARLIHPDGADSFSPENREKLSRAFETQKC